MKTFVRILAFFALLIFGSGLLAQGESALIERSRYYSEASRAAQAGDLPAALTLIDRAHEVALGNGLGDEVQLAQERAHRRHMAAREALGMEGSIAYLEALVDLMRRDGARIPYGDQSARNLASLYGKLKRSADRIRALETAVALGIELAAQGPGEPIKGDLRSQPERVYRLDWALQLSIKGLREARAQAGERDSLATTRAFYDGLATQHAFEERRRLEHLAGILGYGQDRDTIEATYRRLLALQQEHHGMTALPLEATLRVLGRNALRRGDEDDWRELIDYRIAIHEAEAVRRPWNAANRHDVIASIYARELADPDSAERHYAISRGLAEKRSKRSFSARRSATQTARAFRQNGRLRQAIDALEASLSDSEALWGIPSPGTAVVLALYRQALLDYDEAGRLLRVALASLESKSAPADRAFLEGLFILDPQSQLSQRRRGILTDFFRDASREPARVLVMHTLADLALITGQYEEADSWLRKAVALEAGREGTKDASLAFLHAARAEVAALADDVERWSEHRKAMAEVSSEPLPAPSARCAIADHALDLQRGGQTIKAWQAARSALPAIEAAYGSESRCLRTLKAILSGELAFWPPVGWRRR